MNLVIAWISIIVLFSLAIFCLIKSRVWLNLKTAQEYRGFLMFVGIMFLFLMSLSTALFIKFNPELFEIKYITINETNEEYNDMYKNNFSDLIISHDNDYSSESDSIIDSSSSSSSSSTS